MSISQPGTVPPGWYPDPAGGRQWRVWTGTAWSSLTRPYGARVNARARDTTSDLALARALQRVTTIGALGVLGGLGLLVSVLAHWPGTADPTPRWFAVSASGVALVLLVIGSATYALAVKALRGRWTLDAVVPGLNYLVVGVLAARRLGRPSALRVTAEVVLLVIFATSAHVDAWLGVAPVIVTVGQSLWLRVLIDQLGATSTPPPAAAP
jgi:hypothetical protein